MSRDITESRDVTVSRDATQSMCQAHSQHIMCVTEFIYYIQDTLNDPTWRRESHVSCHRMTPELDVKSRNVKRSRVGQAYSISHETKSTHSALTLLIVENMSGLAEIKRFVFYTMASRSCDSRLLNKRRMLLFLRWKNDRVFFATNPNSKTHGLVFTPGLLLCLVTFTTG